MLQMIMLAVGLATLWDAENGQQIAVATIVIVVSLFWMLVSYLDGGKSDE